MRKLVKILLWLIGILIVLSVLIVVATQLFFPAEKIKALAVEKGTSLLGREIEIGDLAISYWGGLGVKLRQVRIGNPEGWNEQDLLVAEYVDLKLRLWPLIFGDYLVDRLVIDKPTINLRRAKDGSINYALASGDSLVPPELQSVPPAAVPLGAAIAFDRLSIRDAQLIYQDDRAAFSLVAFNADITTALKNPRAGFYASEGTIDMDSLYVSGGSDYAVAPFTLEYTAQYDLGSDILTIEEAAIGLGELVLKLSGTAESFLDDPAVRVNVKSDRASLDQLVALLPPEVQEGITEFTIVGDFALDTDLEYNTQNTDGELLYSGTATLTDLTLSRSDLKGELSLSRCLVDFKPDNLRATLEEGSFNGRPLKAHVVVTDFVDPEVKGEIAGAVDLAFVRPFLPPDQQHALSGVATLDVTFAGRLSFPKEMIFSGDLRVDDAQYNSISLPEPIESLSFDSYFDNRLLVVNSSSCRFASGQVSFTGRFTDLLPYLLADSLTAEAMQPMVEGKLVGDLDLAGLNPLLPKKGNPELGGNMAVDLTVSGRVRDLTSFVARGTIDIVDARYTDSLIAEPVEHFSAGLTLLPDTIQIKQLDLKFVSSDASLTGRLIEPFPYLLPLESLDRSNMKKPMFEFALTSHRFDIDKLFPEAVPGSAADPTNVTPDSISMIILPDINGRGTLVADTIVYSEVEFTAVTGQVKIYDRKIDVYDVTAQVYSGSVSGKTSIDLQDFTNPHYVGQFSATQIEANDFVAQFSKFGGFIHGRANMKGSYDAYGWDPNAFVHSLTLDGRADIREGQLKTSGSTYQMLSGFAKQIGETFDAEQTLRAFSTKLKVQDGKVYLNALKSTVGEIGDLSIDGFYGFDGVLNYTGSLNLSEKTTAKALSGNTLMSGLGTLLVDKETGRLVLPLLVSGTIDKPVFKLDYTAFNKKAGDNLTDKATDLLKGLFKKK